MKTKTGSLRLVSLMALLLAIIMGVTVFMMHPLTANAASEETVLKNGSANGGTRIIEDGYYKINAETDWSHPAEYPTGTASDYTMHWDKAAKKLTLKNAIITFDQGSGNDYLSTSGGDLTIELIGTNKMQLVGTPDVGAVASPAIYCGDGNLTIMGTGSLEIASRDEGYDGSCISAKNVTIKDSVTLTLHHYCSSDAKNPVRAKEKINIFGSPTIYAYANNPEDTTQNGSSGMWAEKGYNISGSPKITITSTYAHGLSTNKGMTNSIALYDGGFIDVALSKLNRHALNNINPEDVKAIFEPSQGFGQSLEDPKIKLLGAGTAPANPGGDTGGSTGGNAGDGATDGGKSDGIGAGAVVGITIASVVAVSAGAYTAGYFLLYKNGKLANHGAKAIFEYGNKIFEKTRDLTKKVLDKAKNLIENMRKGKKG